jgi:hypothetical protein
VLWGLEGKEELARLLDHHECQHSSDCDRQAMSGAVASELVRGKFLDGEETKRRIDQVVGGFSFLFCKPRMFNRIKRKLDALQTMS